MDKMFPSSLCVLALILEVLAPSMLVLSKLLFLVLCICYGWTGESVLNFSTGNNKGKI